MKVILLKDVLKVGQRYEVKNVASGYALNFLIPRGLAKITTSGEVRRIEKMKEEEEKRKQEKINELREQLKKVEAKKIELKWQANDKGHLFEGIQKEDIAEALKSQVGISLEPEFIYLDKPIKEIGDYEIEIKAFDFKSKVKIRVKAT
ncbi:MAG: large subunit ribosomal protein L9 [Parcubacteria group bacterium Gr01-1014_107]|nr:MAG: large subunit ribosomal protein L9 [Parcubacteria group bacterium Gr01-1014_107]